MSDHLPSTTGPGDVDKQPEVRLELTRAGVEQVLSLYSQERGSKAAEGVFSIDFEDLQRAIRERRRMLVIGLFSGIAFGALILLLSSPLYSVSAQVVVERRQDSSRSSASENVGSGGSAFVATQAEVMASRSVIEGAVAALPRPAHLDPEADASLAALDAVVATPITGTQVVALGYLGPDGSYGVRLLEAIVESYRKAIGEVERQTKRQELEAKEVEIGLLEAEAVELEQKVAALRVQHDIPGDGVGASEAEAQILRDYTLQMAEARNQRIALENRLAMGVKRLAILDPATKELQDQLWQAEAELARVKLTLMPKHPAVEAAQQNVDALRSQLAVSASATPAALRRDIAAAAGLENQLNVAYERELERLGAIETFRREERVLTTELDRVRALADARRSEMVDQRLLARLADAGEIGITARIIEAPVLPEEATWPRPKLILPATAFLGLIGGFAAALISLKRGRDEWVVPEAATAAAVHTEVQIR